MVDLGFDLKVFQVCHHVLRGFGPPGVTQKRPISAPPTSQLSRSEEKCQSDKSGYNVGCFVGLY